MEALVYDSILLIWLSKLGDQTQGIVPFNTARSLPTPLTFPPQCSTHTVSRHFPSCWTAVAYVFKSQSPLETSAKLYWLSVLHRVTESTISPLFTRILPILTNRPRDPNSIWGRRQVHYFPSHYLQQKAYWDLLSSISFLTSKRIIYHYQISDASNCSVNETAISIVCSLSPGNVVHPY